MWWIGMLITCGFIIGFLLRFISSFPLGFNGMVSMYIVERDVKDQLIKDDEDWLQRSARIIRSVGTLIIVLSLIAGFIFFPLQTTAAFVSGFFLRHLARH